MVEEATRPLELPAHGALTVGVEDVVGRFVDAAWAYRFGPPTQDAIVATLQDGDTVLAQAFHFPAGRPLHRFSADELGLSAQLFTDGESLRVQIGTGRLAYGVRVQAEGFLPDDDAFTIEPGGERMVSLRPVGPEHEERPRVTLTALNLLGAVRAESAGVPPS